MTEHQSPISGETAHERVMVKTGILWASGIGLATLVVVALGLMWVFQLALSNGVPRIQPNEVTQQLSLINRFAPLNPQQQVARKVYEQQQADLLKSYNWVDKKQHLARIPIERAMTLIVQEYGKSK